MGLFKEKRAPKIGLKDFDQQESNRKKVVDFNQCIEFIYKTIKKMNM